MAQPIMGKRVRTLRREHDKSQAMLAAECGVHFMTIWRLEKGLAPYVNTALLEKLCEIFDVSADYLLGRSNRRREFDPEEAEELMTTPHL